MLLPGGLPPAPAAASSSEAEGPSFFITSSFPLLLPPPSSYSSMIPASTSTTTAIPSFPLSSVNLLRTFCSLLSSCLSSSLLSEDALVAVEKKVKRQEEDELSRAPPQQQQAGPHPSSSLVAALSQSSYSFPPAPYLEYASKTLGVKFGFAISHSSYPEGAISLFLSSHPLASDLCRSPAALDLYLASAVLCMSSTSQLGAAARLFFGAGLSIADMVSDLIMIVHYAWTGQFFFAYGLCALLSTNLAIQMLITFIQNRRRGAFPVLFESMLVLTLLKPGIDAYRAVTGHEVEGAFTSAQRELFYGEAVEMIIESMQVNTVPPPLNSSVLLTHSDPPPSPLPPLLSYSLST